ncbi:hypothetical protein Scep_005214 [Stephania cephalantha]|uniref:Carbonic anhydrase n=1 Tax=Stephania cephalantha TaxID=152367 RepID=A0AAP0KWG1_9MAGN
MKNMMMNPSKPILVFGALLVFLALLMDSRLILAQELGPDDENEFSYIKGSDKGPEHWGELQKEWAACGNGKLQSPIDLSNKIVQITSELGMLKTCYKPFDATLNNEGHVIMLQWNGDAGFLEINGTKYFLKQIHWHHPSEHVINGLRFDLEAHLVHASANNETAVLAVMYKLGEPDSLLSEVKV